MTIVVSVHEDGDQRMYFRIVEEEGKLYAERVGTPSIQLSSCSPESSLEAKISHALVQMKRRDE